MDRREAMAWDLANRQNLFIMSSRLYICARTLTWFFAMRKGQSICRTRGTKMKSTVRIIAQWFMPAIVIAVIVSAPAQPGLAQERKAINLSPARGRPFSDGIIAGDTLYVAGQEGTDASDKLVAGGVGPETTAALA